MTAIVRLRPPLVAPYTTASSVRAALPVQGAGQWAATAQGAAWAIGEGAELAMLGPDMNGGTSDDTNPGSSREYRFYFWPHEQNETRLWLGSVCKSTGSSARGTIEVNENGGGYVQICRFDLPWHVPTRQSRCWRGLQFIASPSATAREVSIRFNNDADLSASIFVTGITCVELPVVNLTAVTGEVIPDDTTVQTGAAIYSDGAGGVSIDAAYRSVGAAFTQAWRGTLFNWSCPTPVSSTDAAFDGTSNVFNADIPVLARKRYNGETTKDVEFAALVRGDGGAGEIRVLAASGDSTTVAIPDNASLQWVTGQVACHVDDMDTLATDGGRQSGAYDTLTVEIRVTTATTVYIGSFNVGNG